MAVCPCGYSWIAFEISSRLLKILTRKDKFQKDYVAIVINKEVDSCLKTQNPNKKASGSEKCGGNPLGFLNI